MTDSEHATRYTAYCRRRLIRNTIATVLFFALGLGFLAETAKADVGILAPLLFFGFLASLVAAGHFVWASNDPDPDPDETKRRREAIRIQTEKDLAERAVAREKRKRINEAKQAEQIAKQQQDEFERQQRIEAAEPVITAILDEEKRLGLTQKDDQIAYRTECLLHLHSINSGMAILIGLGWDINIELVMQLRAVEQEQDRQQRLAEAAKVLGKGERNYRFLKKLF